MIPKIYPTKSLCPDEFVVNRERIEYLIIYIYRYTYKIRSEAKASFLWKLYMRQDLKGLQQKIKKVSVASPLVPCQVDPLGLGTMDL